MALHTRNTHFLGTKLRALRKTLGLTLEELSTRCIQLDPRLAPSVSYLSMIESGKRVPSEDLLGLLSSLFQREPNWFLDGSAPAAEAPARQRPGGAPTVPFEPAFLFSKELLQAAIPELLAQTGTSGRQFAHLLIRSHQELARNDFPDLERAAEQVGQRVFPLGVDDLLKLCTHHGIEVRWFDREPVLARDRDSELRSVLRSFYEAPGTIYLNKSLQQHPARLKFDIASHLAHKILHGGDGLKSAHATGGEMGGSPAGGGLAAGLSPQDVLHAWRDFECSFFAGALLCPKTPFRRFLTRESHSVEAGEKIELTPAVMMRRMTKVSPYPYWHFFDAYPPGYLRAVYRGNGIPLPWGNMAQVTDPCPHWAVFRMLHRTPAARIAARRSRCCATATSSCCTCATRGAPRTWRATRTCCRWVSTWCRPCACTRPRPTHWWTPSPRPAWTTTARRASRTRPPTPSPRCRACWTSAGSPRRCSGRPASSARAAPTARARSPATATATPVRARSPTCGRK
jgi:transcriptional regulator with XRE-family HTH domain